MSILDYFNFGVPGSNLRMSAIILSIDTAILKAVEDAHVNGHIITAEEV